MKYISFTLSSVGLRLEFNHIADQEGVLHPVEIVHNIFQGIRRDIIIISSHIITVCKACII